MDQLISIKIFFILFIVAGQPACYATDTLSNKYPGAVLVQLSSEHNRIAAMTKDKNYKALEEVKNDALEVKKRMKLDFTTNFHYCPVYYYMDTNADLIKKKAFNSVLMHADGTPVANPAINSNSNNYVIVYYGYALSQPRSSKVVTDSSKYTYDPDSPPGKGLVILNDKFQQIGHFYKLGYNGFVKKNQTITGYASKHYDIDYAPFAKLFNDRLNEKRRKKNKIRSGGYHAN